MAYKTFFGKIHPHIAFGSHNHRKKKKLGYSNPQTYSRLWKPMDIIGPPETHLSMAKGH